MASQRRACGQRGGRFQGKVSRLPFLSIVSDTNRDTAATACARPSSVCVFVLWVEAVVLGSHGFSDEAPALR